MNKEQKILANFESADARTIKYVGLDLITGKYEVSALVALAKEKNIQNRLGYLADVTAKAADAAKLREAKKMKILAEQLYSNRNQMRKGVLLVTNSSELAKRICIKTPKTAYNKKWNVYSTLAPEGICDWIDLHITENYAA